jgi:hypothetical protein
MDVHEGNSRFDNWMVDKNLLFQNPSMLKHFPCKQSHNLLDFKLALFKLDLQITINYTYFVKLSYISSMLLRLEKN